MTTVTNKEFPAFIALIERARAVIPVHGEVEHIVGYWQMNGCLDIQVTFLQDAPGRLRDFHPGHYTLHFVWNPYQNGLWGPGGWDVRDYGDSEWQIPYKKTDDLLKPHQTHTRDVSNRMVWDGQPLMVGADNRIM